MTVELAGWLWPVLPTVGQPHHQHDESGVNQPGDRRVLLPCDVHTERLHHLQECVNQPSDCGLYRIPDRLPLRHVWGYYVSRQSEANPRLEE